jgi:SAM-dependent methyltransferase
MTERVRPIALFCILLAIACARRETAPGSSRWSAETESTTTSEPAEPGSTASPEELAEALLLPELGPPQPLPDGLKPLPRDPDVHYVPTPEPVVERMLQLAQVKRDDVVYDLGCGDGRIVIAAAQRYGVKAKGFDLDPERVIEARANVKAAKLEHLVTIEQADVFKLDLTPASVITLYLLPELNVRLIPQLEKLRPGSRIVSHDFDMAGVTPDQHVTMQLPAPASTHHHIYLWTTPLKKE